MSPASSPQPARHQHSHRHQDRQSRLQQNQQDCNLTPQTSRRYNISRCSPNKARNLICKHIPTQSQCPESRERKQPSQVYSRATCPGNSSPRNAECPTENPSAHREPECLQRCRMPTNRDAPDSHDAQSSRRRVSQPRVYQYAQERCQPTPFKHENKESDSLIEFLLSDKFPLKVQINQPSTPSYRLYVMLARGSWVLTRETKKRGGVLMSERVTEDWQVHNWDQRKWMHMSNI